MAWTDLAPSEMVAAVMVGLRQRGDACQRPAGPNRIVGGLLALAAAVTLAALTTPEARAGELDPGLRGVSLIDLGAPAAAALDAWLRAEPLGLAEIEQIVLVDVAGGGADGAGAEIIVDVVGRSRPLGRRARQPRRSRARHEAPPEVARVAVELRAPGIRVSLPSQADSNTGGGDALAPVPSRGFEFRQLAGVGRSLLGAAPLPIASARVVRRWAYTAMTFSVRVSIGDQLVVLEDAQRDYRRVFPVGVGAVDAVRRPGQLTSLTPTTDGARIRRATSREALGTPRWARDLPYLTLEVPMGGRARDGRLREAHVKTRLAFHVHATTRFIRGFTSRGCVTLREADLQALADALFFGGGDAIPVTAQMEPLDDARHPYRHEEKLHFALQNFGTAERPEFRVRGNLYVTERVAGPPPSGPLVGVYLDGEARLRRERGGASAGEREGVSGGEREGVSAGEREGVSGGEREGVSGGERAGASAGG